MELVASTYPNSVDVTDAKAATLPLASDTRALDAVRSAVVIVETAPAILATLLASIPTASVTTAAALVTPASN